MGTVCRALACLYRRPDGDSEILTQELFGHRVTVHSVRGAFARCTLTDGYAGWLPSRSVARLDDYAATHVVTDRYAVIRVRNEGPLLVSMGSLVKVVATGTVRHGVELPDGRAGSVGARSVRELAGWRMKPADIPALLGEVIGAPYVWGGKSAFGFDCSGLVQFLFALAGVDLPRDSGDQAGKGRAVRSIRALRPLDLVFFGDPGRVDHVAIHLGDMKIAHASAYVRVESLDRSSPSFRDDLLERFRFGRRVVRL
jgi:cell wall-associated NlpC family hydrolase